MDCITLDRLPVGESAVILALRTRDDMRQRLSDLGFVRDGRVKTRLRSAAGDPTAYEIRGTVIALRAEQSGGILVKPIS